jgi:hypothetical protein
LAKKQEIGINLAYSFTNMAPARKQELSGMLVWSKTTNLKQKIQYPIFRETGNQNMWAYSFNKIAPVRKEKLSGIVIWSRGTNLKLKIT